VLYVMLVRVLLHAADLSNPVRIFDISRQVFRKQHTHTHIITTLSPHYHHILTSYGCIVGQQNSFRIQQSGE